MYKEYFTLGTRGFLKDLASLRSARALNEATCAQSKVLFVHYRNITPPHYDTRSIVNSYFHTPRHYLAHYCILRVILRLSGYEANFGVNIFFTKVYK